MTLLQTEPLNLHSAGKTELRTQFGALVYRVKKRKLQVLMITSRRSGRWIIPKGWPMDGRAPAQTAATEAWEEAGVHGTPQESCLGVFANLKTQNSGTILPCLVMVYAVQAQKLAKHFPEAGQRKRKWMSPKKAAKKVREPELAEMLRRFGQDLPH